jgi:hypothetical protein
MTAAATLRRLLAAVAVAAVLLAPAAHALDIVPVSPKAGATVRTGTPSLLVAFRNGTADPATLELAMDGSAIPPGEDGAPPFGVKVNATALNYTVPALLKLREGNHTLEVHAKDPQGNSAQYTLRFVVNYTVPPAAKTPLNVGLLVLATGGGLVVLAGAAAGGYVWLRRTRGFTLRKHFLRHPGQVKFIALYVPSGAAVVLTLAALYVASTFPHPPRYVNEQILVAGAALAVGPFGLSSLRATLRTRAYERAFAQFLFELADAVRGGINPVKAVQEIAKTGEGILKKPVQQAADVLRLGRPMDEALRAMTAKMGSALVSRYAALVGEASTMGGSVAGVLQRAAKDMDDLVKIQAERRRALRTPVFTMYMAFGVLLVMILQIVSFAPSIGDFDLSALGVGGGSAASAQVAKMPVALMQRRFFHLLLVNATGAGLLVGSFQEGKVRNGLLHAIVMTGIAAVVYPLFAS